MELLEALQVFSGGDRGFLCGATADFFVFWVLDVLYFGFRNHFPYRQEAYVRGSCGWLGVHGLYHGFYRRDTALLHRDTGTVPGENVYGDEEEAALCGEGEQRKKELIYWSKTY